MCLIDPNKLDVYCTISKLDIHHSQRNTLAMGIMCNINFYVSLTINWSTTRPPFYNEFSFIKSRGKLNEI